MQVILRVMGILIVLSLLLSSIMGCARSTSYDYDILVKGGLIYDGTLNPPYKGDVGIKGDKIVAIGNLSGKASKVLDATGDIVTPGFIDCHNHTDLAWQVFRKIAFLAPFLPDWKGNYNYTFQGVSTIITGNCGTGYTNTSAWLGTIKSLGGFGTNVYQLVPYDALKSETIGTDQRPATAQEFEVIKKRVAEEMQKGAVGFSTGLELAPAVYDTTDELVEVAKIVKKYGGIYTTHLRSESGKKMENGETGVITAVKEAIDIGRRSGIPVQISHIKVNYVFMDPQKIIELIAAAQKEGIDVTADQYPYDAGTQRIQILLDNKYLTGEQVKIEFKSPQGRIELKRGVEDALSVVRPEAILIVSCDTKKEYEGKNVKQIADIENRNASDVFIELACMDKPPYCVFFTQDMNIVRQFIKQDWVFTGTDGATLPKSLSGFAGKFHPRFYGTFPKKIRQFVIDEKLIDLQFAIRSMTSLPAEKFGLKNRGKIAEGYYADIAVIDIDKIADKATYENPTEYSIGVVDLIVNGCIEILDGEATGQEGGRSCTKADN
ncbi:MAG: D-aminoacylase [Dehalococcoidia bacterium]